MKLKKPFITSENKIKILRKANDEINKTEEKLLKLRRNNTETKTKCFKVCYGSSLWHLLAFILIIIGIGSIVYTPYRFLMNIRLNMQPGLPPYDWWKDPPDEVLFRVYIFNITNAEEFLKGDAEKLNLQEIGPIVFLEKLHHYNVTFNKNNTMTYVAKRSPIFLPEKNIIDLNATIVVPNLGVLGMASYFSDSAFFAKFGFNLLLRRLESEPISRLSIYEYLYNNTEPLIDLSEKLAPSLVPTSNLGIIKEIYRQFENLVTVHIGQSNGNEKFFLIDQYDGSNNLPWYGDRCSKKLTGTTEGVCYPQEISKNMTVKYWRKSLCCYVELYFEKEVIWNGINSYQFTLPNKTYDRTHPKYGDCFIGNPELPNGIIDISRCYYDLPVGASFPHFLYGDEKLLNSVTGLTPNEERHGSFVLIEPHSGTPLRSVARSQSNLIVKSMFGFPKKLRPFSDLIIPMFYIEYNQVGLPWYIYSLVYFTVNILPIGQKVFSAVCVTLGSLIFAIFIRRKRKNMQLELDEKNESESFLKV